MQYQELQATPGKWAQYLRALRAKSKPGVSSLPALGMALRQQSADRGRVEAYNKVCGFTRSDRLPITYPHMLAFPLHMELMSSPGFPFALLGLVHIRNTISQRRPIALNEKLDILCRTGALYAADKGLQFEIITEALVGNETVWQSTSTMLHRGKVTPGIPAAPANASLDGENWQSEKWQVPSDIGRRYAKVSGDSNPIHLYPLTAKAFGFKRHIAHGMWTKAHALAQLGEFEGAVDIEVQFKTPIFLPATVTFSVGETDGGKAFRVNDARDEKPHVAGIARLG